MMPTVYRAWTWLLHLITLDRAVAAFFLWLIFMVIGFGGAMWATGHFALFLWAAGISAVIVGIMVFLGYLPSRDWEP